MRPRAALAIGPVLLFLLTICAAGRITEAESIGPGRYSGVYHVDRWGRSTFDILYVDPAMCARLAPLAGTPLEIEATEVDQPTNPGPATVMAIGDVKQLPSTIGLSIRWSDSSAPKTPTYLQVAEGTDATLVVTVTNRDSKRAQLWGPPVRSVGLNVLRHHPVPQATSTPEFSPDVGFWAAVLTCEDTTLDVRDKSSDRFKEPPLDARPTLAPGESRSWTVKVRGLPANEYEVSVIAWGTAENHPRPFPLATSTLLLDVLRDRNPSSNGLAVELGAAPTPVPSSDGTPLVGTVTNAGRAPIRLVLMADDIEAGLYCYDAEGRRLPIAHGPRDETPASPITLEAGASRSFHLVAPSGTELARLVFQHQYISGDPAPGKALLPTGPYASAHLRLAR